MADEVDKKGTGEDRFQLGHTWEQVEPGFGQLQDAREVRTGRPALFLRPGTSVDWLLEAGWRVTVSTHRRAPFLRMVVRRAPRSGRTTKLTDAFVLITTALRRVEDDARMDAHLRSGPRREKREPRRAQTPVWRREWAMAALALLSLGVGFWLGGLGEATRPESEAPAANWTDGTGETRPISYPLPKRPWPEQATAPCNTKLDQVEINGGCWLPLERRPPCIQEAQAEYQGKCYFPVGKKAEARPPQSVQP